MFVRTEKGIGRKSKRHKLNPVAHGPYPVVEVKNDTVVIKDDQDLHEEISLERVELAPPVAATRRDIKRTTRKRKQKSKPETSDELDEYVVDRLLKHRVRVYKGKERDEYQVKWYGYTETTWEPCANLPRSMVVRFHKRRKTNLPADLDLARPG